MSLGEALVLIDHELCAGHLGGNLGRRDHLLALFERNRHGLLAQHVLARAQRLDSRLGMSRIGRADTHRIDVGVIEQIVKRVVCGRPVVLGELARAIVVDIVEGDNLRIGIRLVLRYVPHLGDLSTSDDTDANHALLLSRGLMQPLPSKTEAGSPAYTENIFQ